jgi:23S rRNA (uracil1939-C5)-methyltransferase
MVPFRLPIEETLTIEKLVYGGEGLARLEGKVILTPFVLPGEVLRVETERAKNDLWRGRLLEVLQPSPSRVTPGCPYFQRCGGCQYQHIDYPFQLEQKREILREVLRRVGKIEFAGEIGVVSGEPWHYRNRVQLHIEGSAVGYFEQGSRKLCAIDHCPIASPKLNETIGNIQAQRATTALELFSNETEVQVNVIDRVPRPELTALASLGVTTPIEYAGFRVSRNSFFQINRFVIDQLVECAIGSVRGEWAVDLYAGVGLFSVKLAERFTKVTAVESGGSAFRDLTHNFGHLGLSLAAVNTAVEDYLSGLQETPDFILADPPRAGLGKLVVKELARIRAPRLTIVSCDPATLARDLQGLLAGNYRIDKITLVDLFPQTFHLETVVELSA